MLAIFNVNSISEVIYQEIADKDQWIKDEFKIYYLDIESFISYCFKHYLRATYGFKFVDYVDYLPYDLLYDSLFIDQQTNISYIINSSLNIRDVLVAQQNYLWSLMYIDGDLILGHSSRIWGNK